jgi:alpha-beta hydrolase superfamily lysophospholipase
MTTPDYWKSHYVTSTDPAEVELALKQALLDIGGESLEVIYFLHATDAPNVLISQGSGGHGYVFAELAYRLHLGGFNVFVMPKHGGRKVNQLVDRHLEVLQYIRREFNEAIGLYGEGLGGYLAFYLALAHAPIASLICQNAPAILTEPAYHRALSSDRGPWAKSVRRRRAMLPLLRPLALVAPRLQVPISLVPVLTALLFERSHSCSRGRRKHRSCKLIKCGLYALSKYLHVGAGIPIGDGGEVELPVVGEHGND